MARIDHVEQVQHEYRDEARFELRFRPFREWHVGRDLEGEIAEIAARGNPQDVLEVGCGMGGFAARFQSIVNGVSYTAIDQSPRMVELARARGIDARHGDVQSLEFPDASFDLVVANWMLYHVPDLPKALSEIVRVLRPGGALVAATMGDDMHTELWSLINSGDATPELSFSAESGADALRPWFAAVERIDLHGATVFPSRDDVEAYIRSTMTRGHLVDELPHITVPFRARTTNSVFVAT